MDLVVYYSNDDYETKAYKTAEELNVACVNNEFEAKTHTLYLKYDESGLSLCAKDMELQADFTHMIPRLKPNNLNGELLVKAAKVKSFDYIPTILDATAGFAEDSFLLAASGAKVILYEANPIIALLLEDALYRAKYIPEIKEITSRMTLKKVDSIQAMKDNNLDIDIIYLDPMFPEREKSSSIKKKFQILQLIEAPCSNGDELVEAAIIANPKKIILKRPLKGEGISRFKTNYTISGKAIRYDCMVLHK